MNPSLKDIANALHISTTTVSWVLSGKGDERKISMATQEKVMAYARKVNYRPNLLAKSLISGSTRTLGLVVPSIGDEFYAQIAREIELEADKYNYTLTFCSSEANSQRESKIIRMLKSKGVDGLIIAPTQHSQEEMEELIKEEIPFVLIDRFFPNLNTNYVIVDNKESSYQLVRSLIGQGKKKIAFITTDTHLLVMNLRHDGYKQALAEAGLPYDPALYREVKRQGYEQNLVDVFDQLFRDIPDVDGFYFTTHYLGMEALRYFYKNHIDIQHTIALACFHTMPSFEILAPGMNIAHQPIKEIGREAFHTLLRELENPGTLTGKTQLVLSTLMELNQ